MNGRTVVGWAVLVVPVVLVLATFELKAVFVVTGICVAVGVGWLLRSDARQAWQVWREHRAASQATRAATSSALRPNSPGRAGWKGMVSLLFVAGAGGGVAWVAALLGTKGLVATVSGVAAIAALMLVRSKTVFFTFAAVASLAFVLHKSFGPQDAEHSGGAIAVYVTTADLALLLLYALWIHEGTFRSDVRAAARSPLIWLPLAGVVLLLPSLLKAQSVDHSLAELVRMGWMYLLYAYFAIRVRTRAQIWAVLGGLGAIAAVELVVVVLQWRTGGVLGLDFLGVPTSLGERTTDSSVIGRPFGTMIHPVFMAAALGIIAMVAYALALELERSFVTIAALGVTAACLACMWISQARASFVAVVMAGGVVTLLALVRGRIRWRTLCYAALVGLAGIAVFWSKIKDKLSVNFATEHFEKEVASRLELNDIALRMVDDHPLLGVGLNNFEVILPRYEVNPVIFFGNPVHNVYLLFLSEVGIVGFGGVVLLGVVLYDVAITLGRSRDRLFAAVGIGVAGAMGFLMIEELLGLSLRQDIPLALYWLVAGLAVAGLRMSGLSWPRRGLGRSPRRALTDPQATPRVPAPARTGTAVRLTAFTAAVVLLMVLLPGAAPESRLLPAASAAGPPVGLTFTALDRQTKTHGIWVAAADGRELRRITPVDGKWYDWGRFAFGNTKIVYTVRPSRDARNDAIAIRNVDGSGERVLRQFDFPVAQPSVDRAGRFVHFTGKAPWFPRVAQYRMDLRTGEVQNLTAVNSPENGFDTDPTLTGDGRLVFVRNDRRSGAEIREMNPDGTGVRRLTDRTYFNTDPDTSPDGRRIAIASYRGPGDPSAGTDAEDFDVVKTEFWHIVLQDRRGRSERSLTAGANCAIRPVVQSCSITDMSAYVPRFLPDGSGVSFTGALDARRTCICAVDLDGTNPRGIVLSADLALNWHAWPQRPGAARSTAHVGSHVRGSVVLATMTDLGARENRLVIASPDLMSRKIVPLPDRLSPVEARWGHDGRTILFTAPVPIGPRQDPHPSPPSGAARREHITLRDLDPVAAHRAAQVAPASSPHTRNQVFLRTADGQIRQLTDPWLEDWRDGVREGDARSSSQPRMSADGRHVVVTNTSSTTGESFLLRINLITGEVLNLTNGTAGAMPTDDGDSAPAPVGDRLAFSYSDGATRGVYLMDSRTGQDVTAVTDTSDIALGPSWSADGSTLVYTRVRGSRSEVVRAQMDDRGRARSAVVLSPDQPTAWAPVVAPEGDRVAFLAFAQDRVNVYASDRPRTVSRVLQPDRSYNVLSIDWR